MSASDPTAMSVEAEVPCPDSPAPIAQPDSDFADACPPELAEGASDELLATPPASPSTAKKSITVTAPSHVSSSASAATAAAPSKGSSKSKKKKAASVGSTASTAAVQGGGSPGGGCPNENTGRWTAEEHRLFLQGLELHGKGWKKIASLIKSRTVVQIRTHAQKYFQKLAKARQNGEEGDIAMEGRGGPSSVTAVSPNAAVSGGKRRRLSVGTKRKVIESVVASAYRQGKKFGAVGPDGQPLPTVAPALAHFVLPVAPSHSGSNCVPSITTAQGTISGPALEDSLYVYGENVCYYWVRSSCVVFNWWHFILLALLLDF
jgi:SHAQKYF class myb-like DNA-binding protein